MHKLTVEMYCVKNDLKYCRNASDHSALQFRNILKSNHKKARHYSTTEICQQISVNKENV